MTANVVCSIADDELAGLDPATSARLLAERDRLPYASIADFERRAGRALASLGLTAVSGK